MHAGLITFLKACAVLGLTLFGVSITHVGWRAFPLDPIGVGIGVARLVGALIAFVTWFLKHA
jgi:hypothetical protein